MKHSEPVKFGLLFQIQLLVFLVFFGLQGKELCLHLVLLFGPHLIDKLFQFNLSLALLQHLTQLQCALFGLINN